ncbi:VOC family protein [Halorarum halobium]|uniref:VOC family protein n=1 Tax=Halorarum halobium TaxID=3075121 RepID=UPI0028AE7D25|nr:VOC family protein [Halobaculum sp. XH14]
MADSEIPVTAETPDSAFHTTGTDHITLIGSNEADTVAFYRDVLGMSLVLRQPNLDAPEVTHLFFDTGDGRILTFFVTDDRDSNPAPQRTGVGAVHHLAFSIEAGELDEIKAALQEEGHGFNEFDRGAFHSLYTRDHNGLTIELVVDKYAIPDDRRGEVLALSQSKRVAAGADYVDDEHMQAALEELGLPVERADIPDAATGTGYDN